MALTYEPIATTTLGSAASSITFSSIAATYTDLRVVLTIKSATNGAPFLRLNGAAGTAYSQTELYGNGSTATSSRSTSTSEIALTQDAIGAAGTITFYTVDVFSYAGSTNKTVLVTGQTDKNGSGMVYNSVGLYRSTSAITSLSLHTNTTGMDAGTIATLYGIKAA